MIIAIGSHQIDTRNILTYTNNLHDSNFKVYLKDGTNITISYADLQSYKTQLPADLIRDGWNQDMIDDKSVPTTIIFFANNTACVGNKFDQQIGKYQVGTHKDTIKALAADGYDYTKLSITGIPKL